MPPWVVRNRLVVFERKAVGTTGGISKRNGPRFVSASASPPRQQRCFLGRLRRRICNPGQTSLAKRETRLPWAFAVFPFQGKPKTSHDLNTTPPRAIEMEGHFAILPRLRVWVSMASFI